jgi:hypothetical protein
MSVLCKSKSASFDPGGQGVAFLVCQKGRFITGEILEVNESFLMVEYAARQPVELGCFVLVFHILSHKQ